MRAAKVDDGKKDRQRGGSFAEGGKGKMFAEQVAGAQKSGRTGHAVKGGAPGAQAAKGGGRSKVSGLSVPARPGRTAPAR
jgi:hypothetical protein